MFNFGRTKRAGRKTNNNSEKSARRAEGKMTWDLPVFFGIMFVLSIVELGFTGTAFVNLHRRQEKSHTERARLAFLAFSSARTIALSAVYMGLHCARKVFHSMFHTIFLVISTGLWIASGVVIHQMWGIITCGGVGGLKGGLSLCHQLKIIEILAWVLAAVSVLAAIPVVMHAMKRRKNQAQRKTATSG